MPKTKDNPATRARKYASEFTVFKADKGLLMCTACEKSVSSDQRGHVLQHLKSTIHKENEKWRTTSTQSFLQFDSPVSCQYSADLCAALISGNIAFNAISDPVVRAFLAKYHTKDKVPDESTLRKNYMEKVYMDKLGRLRRVCAGKLIWISIDETTDVRDRYVANVIVGILDPDFDYDPYILDTVFLSLCTGSTMWRTRYG